MLRSDVRSLMVLLYDMERVKENDDDGDGDEPAQNDLISATRDR